MTTIQELDADISKLKSRIADTRSRHVNLASILLSQPNISTRLQGASVSPQTLQKAQNLVKTQQNHDTASTYRLCAGITAYKVRDPDPNAIDKGNILGLRIDVCIRGAFLETYHVLLNRPRADSGNEKERNVLKIHKHTIPTCVPLKQIAGRWLPQGRGETQDLEKFAKVLRRELMSWHLRSAALEKLRAEAGLDAEKKTAKTEEAEADTEGFGAVLNAFVSDDEHDEDDDEFVEEDGRSRPFRIVEIEADLAVRHLEIRWLNGQSAVLDVSKDGEVTNAVVKTKQGERMADVARKALGRMEGLVQRIRE